METWVNGEKGSKVKHIIDNNFDILDKRTARINDDVSKLMNNSALNSNQLVIEFAASDWVFAENLKTYTISIPHVEYNKSDPCVWVYIKNEGSYSLVYGGYVIGEYGIVLQSDISYEGKVVIR